MCCSMAHSALPVPAPVGALVGLVVDRAAGLAEASRAQRA